MSQSLFYGLIWGLQILSIGFFHFAARKRTATMRVLCRDLNEAHHLLIKAMKVLRDHDDFDSRYTWHELDDYMTAKLRQYGLDEVPVPPRRPR